MLQPHPHPSPQFAAVIEAKSVPAARAAAKPGSSRVPHRWLPALDQELDLRVAHRARAALAAQQ
jgi:hypothetical protein